MHISRKLVLAALALGSLAGCGASVAFEGKSGIAITGTPPARIKKAIAHSRVNLTAKSIEITEKIQFELNKATILPESFGLLDEIAGVMKEHPELKRIAIEGHASSDGDKVQNKTLSDARAKSVMAYLTTKGGVDTGRLTATGYGDERPIGDNNTEDGRVKNRRVEFNIVERDDSKKK